MTTLKRREKALAAVTGGLVLLVVGRYLFSAWQAPREALRAERDRWTTDVAQKEVQVKKGKAAQARLVEWNRRSLPSDPDTARSQYYAWLLKLVKDEVRFSGTKIDTGAGPKRSGIFQGLHFTVKAEGTLDQLIEFLHKFRSAGYLHEIRSVTVKPTSSGRLDLTIIIEALCLAGADQKDRLPPEQPGGSDGPDLAEYRKAVVHRNLFAAYRPPREERRGPELPPPVFDPAQYAYLSGIVAEDREFQAWLLARTSGKLFQLREGDSFEVGQLRGKVVRIAPREAEIEIDGQRWLFPIGDNLREIVKLSGADGQ